jgi:arsenate reductase
VLLTMAAYNVLFLCTGNSARSILAEAILNRIGRARFRGFSAGSFPKGQVHPGALRLLARLDYPTETFRSKAWDEFAGPGAPEMHLVITVCDGAAGEVCPVWPGRPATAHWGLPDPAAVQGDDTEIDAAFDRIHNELVERLERLVGLDFEALDGPALKACLAEIHAGSTAA